MFIRLFALLIIYSLTSYGQIHEQAETVTIKLKIKLGLSETQTAAVREIIREQFEKAKQDSKNLDNNRDRIKAAVKRMEEGDSRIERLLNFEQRKRFEEYKEGRRVEMRERMKERQY